MKRWKSYQVALFVLFCVMLNVWGLTQAERWRLPLWLDSFGTVLCAYVGGPVCGALVGVTSNVIHGMTDHISYAYALTSIAMGVIVGIGARKRMLNTVFGTVSMASMVALAAVVISVPLNVLLNGGYTGNVWGDGVIGFLREHNVLPILSYTLGQFYIDFLDKVLTLVALYLAVKAWRALRNRRHSPMEKTALALALMCLLAPANPARGEADVESVAYNDYVQTVYSSGNGLDCGEANDIAQTSDGILWVGTYNGLYRYNGSEFRRQTLSRVKNVNCLYVDDEGRLWVGTNDNGLSIIIDDEPSNVIDESSGLPSNSVRSISESTDDYYYIGTSGSMEVLTLNGGLKKVSTLWEISHCEKSATDQSGHAAAVSADGRLFLLKQGRIQSSLRRPSESEIYKSCAFAPDGRLLAATSLNHIDTFDISGGSFEKVGERSCEGLTSINDLYFMPSGEMFIAADNGVGYIDIYSRYNLINTNDFNNSIDNMLVDYQGNLWFTSSRKGLFRMAPSSFKDVYTATGLSSRVANAVTQWRKNYYFATDKGLDAVNENCRYPIYNMLTEKFRGVRIRCLLTDSRQSLWICTYGQGVTEMTLDGTEYVYSDENGAFGPRARVVTELSDGTVVIGGNLGISYIRDHQVVKTLRAADGLANDTILSLMELADGRLLAGTDGGGLIVLRDGEIERTIPPAEGQLSSGVVMRTVRDPKSDGAFIVTSNGLCYMEPDLSVRTLENFPYFNNYAIWARDADTLFVMGSAGIFVVSRDDVYNDVPDMRYDLLDARRGLNSALTANAFSFYDGESQLFLPCDRGVFIIDTENYASVINRYRMSVPTVRLDNETVRVDRGAPIEVARDVSRIELHPEILNYTIQEPNVGYMLEGFDTDWTIIPQSNLGVIVYTNLPAGDYLLRLAVFDNNKTDILEERDFTLVKQRAIYDSRGFIAYLLLVPMIAVAWFTWFIMRRQLQRTLDLQERELRIARQQIQMGNETVIAIAKAVDAKDERTSQHSQRVSEYSVMIARELGFSEQECENLRRAALMHDIGKIGIPDSILNKPARLTDEEYAIMKSHVTRGAEILKDFTLIDNVVEGALHHHERYDGRGYPSGMKGEEIPVYGRIIGVADAFDAMTANRVYRRQMDFGYVLEEMRKGRGTQFDPQFVDILLKLIDDGKIDLNALYPQKPAEPETAAGGQS